MSISLDQSILIFSRQIKKYIMFTVAFHTSTKVTVNDLN